jgi:hypothetical protein
MFKDKVVYLRIGDAAAVVALGNEVLERVPRRFVRWVLVQVEAQQPVARVEVGVCANEKGDTRGIDESRAGSIAQSAAGSVAYH